LFKYGDRGVPNSACQSPASIERRLKLLCDSRFEFHAELGHCDALDAKVRPPDQQTAHTRHSAGVFDAAVAARIPAIRCKRKILARLNLRIERFDKLAAVFDNPSTNWQTA